jgi:hypothetical protein
VSFAEKARRLKALVHALAMTFIIVHERAREASSLIGRQGSK